MFFSPFQDIHRILQGIKFNDPQSAVAFKGIAEAFPNVTIYDSSIGQDSPGPHLHYALINACKIFLKDNCLVALTRLGEQININNRSRNDYQSGRIQGVELPVRKPTSEEDVGGLILISFGSGPTEQGRYWGKCEGIPLNEHIGPSLETSKLSVSGRLKIVVWTIK